MLTFYSLNNYFPCNTSIQLVVFENFRECVKEIYLKLLCGVKGGFERPDSLPIMSSCFRTDTNRHILSAVLLSIIIPGFGSPVKCGNININEPIPIITAPGQ